MQVFSSKAWNFAKNVSLGAPCAIIFAVLLTAAPTWLFADLNHAEWYWGCPLNSYVYEESSDGDYQTFCWSHILFDLFFWMLFFALTGLAVRWVFRKFGFTIRPFYSVCIMGALIGALYVYVFRPDQLINLETGGYLGFLETPSEQMHLAMWPGNVERVEILLQKYPGLVSSTNIVGDTPLHEAAYYGHCDIIKLLLAAKANVRSKDRDGRTPIFNSVLNRYVGATELLLKNGADINARNNDGEAPLFEAAEWGDDWSIKWLLANKAEVNVRSKWRVTPLHKAVMNGSTNTVRLLIASNAEVNVKDDKGETPLYLAAYNDQKDIVELLLADKADVNVRDNFGKTALQIASSRGCTDVAELLRQYGATNN